MGGFPGLWRMPKLGDRCYREMIRVRRTRRWTSRSGFQSLEGRREDCVPGSLNAALATWLIGTGWTSRSGFQSLEGRREDCVPGSLNAALATWLIGTGRWSSPTSPPKESP